MLVSGFVPFTNTILRLLHNGFAVKRPNAREGCRTVVQIVRRSFQELQSELEVVIRGLRKPDLGAVGLRCDLAPGGFVVLERILRVLGLEVRNRMKRAPDIEGADLGQRVNLEDMVGIRVLISLRSASP